MRFPSWWIVPLAILYVTLRIAGKVVGTAFAAKIAGLPFPTPRRAGLGLVPQGGISLAMAVSVVLTYQGLDIGGASAVDLFFVIVVLGVVVSELVGPFVTTAMLRRAGEISPRVEEALEAGDEARAKEEALRHVSPSPTPDEEADRS